MRLPHAVSILILVACADPTDAPSPQVIIDGGAERQIRIGTQEQLAARVVGVDGTKVIEWTSSDPSIARVDDNGVLRIATSYTSCGWVTPGECRVRITARAGSLQAEQTLIVVPFEPTLELNVSHLDVESGDSARIQARVLLELRDVPWCAVAFTSNDSMIASVGRTSGVVRGSDLGSTTVDVNASGTLCPRGAAHVTVVSRAPRYVLTIEPETNTELAPGSTLQLQAIVTNWKEVRYPAISVQWSTSDARVATVVNGLLRVGSCDGTTTCQVTISARSGRLTATRLIWVSNR